VVLPRLPAPDWSWRLRSDTEPVRVLQSREGVGGRRVLTPATLEQVCLLTLLCIIFANILPGLDATVPQLVLGIGAIVIANAAITAAVHRGRLTPRSAIEHYLARLLTNVVFLYAGNAMLGDRRDFAARYGIFFAFLITTMIWLHDAFYPVHQVRFTDSTLRVRSVADLLRRVREPSP
jgi:hypothetical protein